MQRFLKILNKVLEIKVNALVLLFAGTVLVYAASKGTDGLWKFSSGDPISSTQINQNFEAVNVPSGAIMAFNRDTCPTDKGWVLADGNNGTPDLRGVFVRGLDLGAGRDAGRTLGNYQDDAFKSHTHSIYSEDYIGANPGGNTANFVVSNVAYMGETAEKGGSETRPKNVALLYCMKK